MRNLGLIVLTAALFAACSTTINKSSQSAQLEVSMKAKLNADVEVDMTKKITGTATKKKILFFTVSEPKNYIDGVQYFPGNAGSSGGFFSFLNGGTESVKSAAAYNAIQSAKADFIVAPVYLIKTVDDFYQSEVTVQVTGYAGKIKDIKPNQEKN